MFERRRIERSHCALPPTHAGNETASSGTLGDGARGINGRHRDNTRGCTARVVHLDLLLVSGLIGTASDACPAILATGRSDVSTIFTSLSKRHPEGRDSEYLEWHSLDHRPEQHRLARLRMSFRLVSTPSCRAARAASNERYDDADHVMTYFFTDPGALDAFDDLSVALREAGRAPYLLPMVERATYRLGGMAAAARIRIGADVLPWWPIRGVYLLIERGESPGHSLVNALGVGGAWWGAAQPLGPPFCSRDNSGLQITYLFLDDEPADAARRLRPLLERRWSETALEPLLAAPFHSLVPYDWGRYCP